MICTKITKYPFFPAHVPSQNDTKQSNHNCISSTYLLYYINRLYNKFITNKWTLLTTFWKGIIEIICGIIFMWKGVRILPMNCG